MSKKQKKIFIIVDLEADGGTLLAKDRTYKSIDDNINILKKNMFKHDLKINFFVEGQLLEERPDIVETFHGENKNVNFNLHGYNHSDVNLSTDVKILNIEKAINAFTSCFGCLPKAYRAPNGIITDKELHFLKKKQLQADLSIFPSFFPGRFNNVNSPLMPYRHSSGLVEIPCSVITPMRIPLGLSYAQLLGKNIFLGLLKLFPLAGDIVFYLHLHDLAPSLLIDKIENNIIAQIAYLWNSRCDVNYLSVIIDYFYQAGYSSGLLDNHVDELCEKL